jgi:hypothetical protein
LSLIKGDCNEETKGSCERDRRSDVQSSTLFAWESVDSKLKQIDGKGNSGDDDHADDEEADRLTLCVQNTKARENKSN